MGFESDVLPRRSGEEITEAKSACFMVKRRFAAINPPPFDRGQGLELGIQQLQRKCLTVKENALKVVSTRIRSRIGSRGRGARFRSFSPASDSHNSYATLTSVLHQDERST